MSDRACHHIKVQDGCDWCEVYTYHSIRQCDRCKQSINSDLVYLSLSSKQPQLICIYCHYDEVRWEVK